MILSILFTGLLVVWAVALVYILWKMKTMSKEKRKNFSNLLSIAVYFPAFLGFVLTSAKVDFFTFGYQLFFKLTIALSLILYAIFRGFSMWSRGAPPEADSVGQD